MNMLNILSKNISCNSRIYLSLFPLLYYNLPEHPLVKSYDINDFDIEMVKIFYNDLHTFNIQHLEQIEKYNYIQIKCKTLNTDIIFGLQFDLNFNKYYNKVEFIDILRT